MRAWAVVAALALGVACSHSSGTDGTPRVDPGDGGTVGAGDGGSNDGGGNNNPGGNDGGTGTETTGVKFGTPGPWPVTNVTYGAADGILEQPIVGVTTDENQNLWVATNAALYLRKPGDKSFTRYDASSGLHLPGNPVQYCDRSFADGDRSCPIYGAAVAPGISDIVGGGAAKKPAGASASAEYYGEVFVGYYGFHDWNSPNDGTWADLYRHTGKLDRVRLNKDGTLDVVRFDMVSGNSVMFWHNRTVWKMVYDHFIHKHELYVGTDHGVDKFSPDLWKPTTPGTWFNGPENNLLWMSDHLHPQVCYHHPCVDESDLRLGDWRGLGIDANGDLWVAGRWAAGLIKWVADNSVWYDRGGGSYLQAFGDPYYGNCTGSRPVFCPPAEGDSVNLSAVTVTPDGRIWFSSGLIYADNEPNYGIAVLDLKAKEYTYYNPMRDLGLGEMNIRDMISLPDGRLVVATPTQGAVIWDPVKGTKTPLTAGNGLPDNMVTRLQLDTMVDPPQLLIATYSGAVVMRKLP